jgi:hypothetical protein
LSKLSKESEIQGCSRNELIYRKLFAFETLGELSDKLFALEERIKVLEGFK